MIEGTPRLSHVSWSSVDMNSKYRFTFDCAPRLSAKLSTSRVRM